MELLGHPDRSMSDYILTGLCHGFPLFFNPAAVSLRSASHTMSSASLQPEVIDNYLLAKMDKDRIAGLFPTPPLTILYTGQFGRIPKKHQPGKWHLMLDLSSNLVVSMTAFKGSLFLHSIMSVDDIIDGIMDFGTWTLDGRV